MTDPIITIRDLRRAGICKDARFWFEGHGFDWRDFVMNGISGEALLKTGDARAEAVVARAREDGR